MRLVDPSGLTMDWPVGRAVAATLALLVIVAGAYRDLHWLALLVGMFVALKANLFVILIKA